MTSRALPLLPRLPRALWTELATQEWLYRQGAQPREPNLRTPATLPRPCEFLARAPRSMVPAAAHLPSRVGGTLVSIDRCVRRTREFQRNRSRAPGRARRRRAA